MGLSLSWDDRLPNCIQMEVHDDGGDRKYSVLSICEGGKYSLLPPEGYGIHLRAENDNPTITFKFRDGREEECHAPATDSDFADFLELPAR